MFLRTLRIPDKMAGEENEGEREDSGNGETKAIRGKKRRGGNGWFYQLASVELTEKGLSMRDCLN